MDKNYEPDCEATFIIIYPRFYKWYDVDLDLADRGLESNEVFGTCVDGQKVVEVEL